LQWQKHERRARQSSGDAIRRSRTRKPAKRKLRALEQSLRDIGRLADRVTRAYKASRARLLVLAEHVAAEQGLELRQKFPIARTREELDRQEGPIERATNNGSIGTGVDRNV
jgi:hypothetical protein